MRAVALGLAMLSAGCAQTSQPMPPSGYLTNHVPAYAAQAPLPAWTPLATPEQSARRRAEIDGQPQGMGVIERALLLNFGARLLTPPAAYAPPVTCVTQPFGFGAIANCY